MGLFDFLRKKPNTTSTFNRFETESKGVLNGIYKNALLLQITLYDLCPEVVNTPSVERINSICFAGLLTGALLLHPDLTRGQVQILNEKARELDQDIDELSIQCMDYFKLRTTRYPLDELSASSGMPIERCICMLVAEWVVRILIGGGYEIQHVPMTEGRMEIAKRIASFTVLAGEDLGAIL